MNEYNIFTTSFLTESVLCDIEFIPEESLKKINKVREFIQLQTYYKQSDGILIGLPSNKKAKHCKIFLEFEIAIKIEWKEIGYEVTIFREKKILMKRACAEMHAIIIRDIVQKVIWRLTEEDNE